MTNKAFIQSLAERMELNDDEVAVMTDRFVSTFLYEVQTRGLVSIQGFGNFEIKERAERKMYNPTTKSFKVIPSKKIIGFKMSSTLKSRINQK